MVLEDPLSQSMSSQVRVRRLSKVILRTAAGPAPALDVETAPIEYTGICTDSHHGVAVLYPGHHEVRGRVGVGRLHTIDSGGRCVPICAWVPVY